MVDDAKPGDVEAVVQEQLDAASSKVVIEELVSYMYTLYTGCSYYMRQLYVPTYACVCVHKIYT